MSRHVAVLMGGWSAERDVSLVSGAAVADALEEKAYQVTRIDVDRDIAGVLAELRPDAAFNALHGRFGEDGCIQGVLEVLEIPYTHSGVLASALAMHKPTARRLFGAAGLPCPEGEVVRRDTLRHGEVMPPPYVVKPVNEGSSVGVTIVLEGDSFSPSDITDSCYGETVLVERYIPGHEIHVAVMGDRALGAIEIKPLGRFTTTTQNTRRARLSISCRRRWRRRSTRRRSRLLLRHTRRSAAAASAGQTCASTIRVTGRAASTCSNSTPNPA